MVDLDGWNFFWEFMGRFQNNTILHCYPCCSCCLYATHSAIQYCRSTCNTQCNTILKPNIFFFGSSWDNLRIIPSCIIILVVVSIVVLVVFAKTAVTNHNGWLRWLKFFFGSSWEDSRIIPSCIVTLVVPVVFVVSMQYTVQYNTAGQHATHSAIQYWSQTCNTW